MNRRLLTALGASALIVATVMPAGVTAARPGIDGQAKTLRTRRRQQDRQVADQGDPGRPRRQRHRRDARPVRRDASTSRGSGQVADRQAAQGRTRTPSPARSASSAARSRRSTSTPTTASSCASRAASSMPWPSCRASRRSTPVRTYTADNRHSVPFIGAPAVWQDFGDHAATARRSPSSTPASTTPTPTSAARAPRRRTTTTTPTSSSPARSRPPRSSPAGTSSATTTTRTTTTGPRSRRPTPTRSTATATAPTSPARAAGLRRQVGPHDVHRPLQLVHLLDLVRHRPGRGAEGQAGLPQGVRLRRRHERPDRRPRVGRRSTTRPTRTPST